MKTHTLQSQKKIDLELNHTSNEGEHKIIQLETFKVELFSINGSDEQFNNLRITEITVPTTLNIINKQPVTLEIFQSLNKEIKSRLHFTNQEDNYLQFPITEDTEITIISLNSNHAELQLLKKFLPPLDNIHPLEINNPFIELILNATNRLINCNKRGLQKKLYSNWLIKEIVFHFFEGLSLNNNSEIENSHSSLEIEKLNEASKILLKDLKKKPTIREISRTIGLNEFKLKRGFKLLYGDTIFGFLTKHRMQFAKNQILNSKTPINEIAENVGYGYTQHFSVAFKKYYGITPIKMRLKILGRDN